MSLAPEQRSTCVPVTGECDYISPVRRPIDIWCSNIDRLVAGM